MALAATIKRRLAASDHPGRSMSTTATTSGTTMVAVNMGHQLQTMTRIMATSPMAMAA